MKTVENQHADDRRLMVRAMTILLGLGLPAWANAQQFSLSGGSASSCSGAIEDSGGPSAPYSDNEDLEFTICPDAPGSSVQLTWYVFDLSTEGTNIDNLTIHDGDDASAPTLGTYTGNELSSLDVTATVFNPTGCLTLVFRSNGVGTGDLACGIQCITACDHPTASATMSEVSPALLCVGDVITFDGSLSTPAPGHSIVGYTWMIGGEDPIGSEAPTLVHAFPGPGSYPIALQVTDETGCTSTNAVDLLVQVATVPLFTLSPVDSVACIGQQLTLSGTALPTAWSAYGENYGAGVILPDDVGQPFHSEVFVTGFLPGSVVTSETDISSICVDIEHSFMGDLVLQVICPNGSTTILHQQGGGGVYLGDANDMDYAEPDPGTCWSYCWNSTATNGTLVENSTTNTVQASQGTALAPGTYEPVQPFTNLLGCPLNGEWIFQSTDLWGSDNGTLCQWSVQFDASLGGDTTTIVPAYGPGCDSTFWSGTDIIWAEAECDSIVISPSNTGPLEYTYTAIDNFGCVHDTSLVIQVLPSSDPYCIAMDLGVVDRPSISVFPLPATDQVTVTGAGSVSAFTVFDLGGRTMLSGRPPAGSGHFVVDLQRLPRGSYILELIGGSGRTCAALLKE